MKLNELFILILFMVINAGVLTLYIQFFDKVNKQKFDEKKIGVSTQVWLNNFLAIILSMGLILSCVIYGLGKYPSNSKISNTFLIVSLIGCVIFSFGYYYTDIKIRKLAKAKYKNSKFNDINIHNYIMKGVLHGILIGIVISTILRIVIH